MSVQSPATELLNWYDRHARSLPWRTPPGSAARPDPYAVWLSEIMLQQTTVAAVIPYFQRFMQRWPTVGALAASPLEEVLSAWAGLGYYARARNLHACAQAIVHNHGGRFPDTEAGLLTLPGIGVYTAAAIAAIAFDAPAAVVDGNIERVISRLQLMETPLPQAKPLIRSVVAGLTPAQRPGDFAQAMMDLGATICTPRTPQCSRCPWVARCAAAQAGDAERFPVKPTKADRPDRFGIAYWVEARGHVLLRRRPAKGLLGGMVEVPGSPWAAGALPPVDVHAPLVADWRQLPGRVVHVFTHFRLELTVVEARLADRINPDAGFWHPLDDLATVGLPTVMAKVADHVLAAQRLRV
jgi:A/G-specific adenine glycosylase